MSKYIFTCLFFILMATHIECQDAKPEDTEVWDPQPEIIDPGTESKPPGDAIVLLGPESVELAAWESVEGGEAGWIVENGIATVRSGAGNIRTKEEFGDMQLHIEWRTPEEVQSEGQGRGNSGVFLQGMYEIQILDNYNNKTYANGQAGSLYKQAPPLVNVSRPPGEWQVYDIIYKAPTFTEEGEIDQHGYVTVLHNGVVIQNNTKIKGTTEYIGPPQVKPHEDGPIILQDHGNPVSFRNIWVRKL